METQTKRTEFRKKKSLTATLIQTVVKTLAQMIFHFNYNSREEEKNDDVSHTFPPNIKDENEFEREPNKS